MGLTGHFQWDLPVILNGITRSLSVGLSNHPSTPHNTPNTSKIQHFYEFKFFSYKVKKILDNTIKMVNNINMVLM